MEKIRRAKASDLSRIAEIFVFNYRLNFYQFFKNDQYYFDTLNVIGTAAELEAHLGDIFVYDDGCIRGFMKVSGSELEKLYVDPQFQSRGIGAELLGYAVDRLGAEWLWALEYNTRGQAFYRRHGFELTGEKMIEDEWVPLLKMALINDRER